MQVFDFSTRAKYVELGLYMKFFCIEEKIFYKGNSGIEQRKFWN